MDASASSLLETLTLDSSDPQTLISQFSSYLHPLFNLNNKKKSPSSTTLRPLAKKFLPFLSGALKLIPGLLRSQSPSLGPEKAAAILDVYRLVIDCMDSISPCFAGNSNFVLVERGGLVCSLELWGKYEEAKEEGVSVLKKLGIDVSGGVCGRLDDREPEIVGLAGKVVCSLVGCVYKNKSKDGDEYEWILGLVELVGPKLRALDPKSTGKYHPMLVNSLYRCSLFIAAEYISFHCDLVTRFCQMILLECLQSSIMDRFSNISCSICKSFDKKWERKPFLILDLLRVTLKSTLCGCKAGVVKVVDELLEFVSYCSESFPAASIDICSHAVELLYEQGGDFLQVSPPVASIMFLYATGLYFKYNNVQAKHELEVLSLNKAPNKLRLLSDSVGVLIKYSTTSSYRNEVSLKHEVKETEIVDLESWRNRSCKQLHGNASLLSYLDAMDFLCRMLVEYVNMTWKCLTSQGKALCISININEIQDVMHQFCDFVLAAFRCQKASERDKQWLQESRTTLLQVAVSAFKLSLGTSSNHQKSLFLLNCVISSEWIEPQELNFLIAELGIVGASLYNLGQLKQASVALQLRCKTIWTHVKLLCQLCSDKSKGIQCGDTSDELLKTVTESFEKCARIVDTLHKCGSADFQDISFLEGNVYEIAVKSLVELSSADNTFPDSTGSFVLVKQWVKMLCRDFKDADAVNNAPVLYSFLKTHCATWSNMVLGKILEQELLAYDVMEARNPDLSRKMQLRVVDILLDGVFTAREYNLQRARILVRKGRFLRACGMEGLHGCLNCLRDAICLLNDIPGNPSPRNSSVYNQLAVTHLLAAQCTQEASQYSLEDNQDPKLILQDIRKALELWSNIDMGGHCSVNDHPEVSGQSTIPLLCSIVDLLSMKGCLELQIGICKLIITYFKREKTPVDTCLSMLWSGRRVNHSLCSSPVDKDVVLYASEHLDTHANTFEFWVSCLKGDPSDLLAFLQKFLLCDSLIPELSLYNPKKCHGLEVTVDEVKKAASSLISEIPLSSQSASIAGYLYYDLSERLFSNGHLFEALSHARMALLLRRNILRRKFICSFEQQPANHVDSEKVCQNRHDHVCLEAIGSVITEVWPDSVKYSKLKIPILTPWSVLRCYLESILQVGIINESIGNGTEAEVLFLTGKRISCLQDFPIFQIVFMTLLGQVYRKQQLYDFAENELQSARKILMENEMIISCNHCMLSLDASIDMQFGDLYRYSSEKGCQIQSAKTIYQSALRKLNHDELEISLSICKKLNNNDMKEAKFGVLNIGKIPLEHGAVECDICASSSLDDDRAFSSLDDDHASSGLNDDRRPRTRSRARASNNNKSANIISRESDSFGRSTKHDSCRGNASLAKPRMKTSKGCSQLECEDTLLKKAICWRCLNFIVMEGGIMQDIIYLKWECHRRHLLLRLLMKIAKCKHGTHEVHDAFWQCISVMFYQKLLSKKYINAHASHLFKLIGKESSRDIFPIERATMLYNISEFVLNHCQSEHNRKSCCPLANLHLPDVVSWLLSAFINFREIPLLFQKVSKLLALMLLISTIRPVLVPFFSESSLSIDHWAAYFHQASLGTYLPCQYLACVKDTTFNSKDTEDTSSSSMLDTFIETSNFLRLAPERLESLEEFVRGFFPCLPTVPIICISIIGNDCNQFIGESLHLPILFPAWMLISRLHASGQPIVMLLPVKAISEEVHLEDSTPSPGFLAGGHELMDWQCPWGYTVLDSVAPSFKLLLKENFLSSSIIYSSADSHTNKVNWWMQRTRLDKCLKNLLKSMEDSWLGPWICLLLGAHSDPPNMSKRVAKLIEELKLHFKFEANNNMVKAILGGSMSVADAEACISQLLSYKGHFGRGAGCEEEMFRTFSSDCQNGNNIMPESVHRLILEAVGEVAETSFREPIIFVLNSDLQMLCLENLPVLRSQEIYRMPSVSSIILTLKRCSHSHKQDRAFGATFPFVDPLDTYFLLNPSGDLDNTQVEFEQWFRNHKWEGEAGKVPRSQELISALRHHDLFLYFGHGSGMQYISGKEILKLDQCAATLLMGCSSGSLSYKGCFAPRGAPLSYLFAGSPAIIANLWDVTDKDIDRFGKSMLSSWLQEETSVRPENCTHCNKLTQEFGCLELGDSRSSARSSTRRKAITNEKKLQQFCDKGPCEVYGRKRIASFMHEAREACKLPYLIGASPVCYGVPTVILKKS